MMTREPQNHHHEAGAKLKRLRQATHLSQENFAVRLGITRRHLIRLENGEHRPSKTLAAKIEGACGGDHGGDSG